MRDTLTYTGTLVVMGGCWNCGSIYAIPERLYKDAKQKGTGWYCCACGKSTCFTTTENDRLKQKAEKAERDAAWWREDARREARAAQDARNRERAQKAAKTRLKNRISNGVCPCCKRHFANVERHIKGQHPDFVVAPAGGTDA